MKFYHYHAVCEFYDRDGGSYRLFADKFRDFKFVLIKFHSIKFNDENFNEKAILDKF